MTARHFALILCLTASAALAHQGVQDPQVMARMSLMEEIKQATGILGGMARQPGSHSPEQAEAARNRLIALSGDIPDAFRDPADDPKSESRREIWDDWEDFTARASALEDAARQLDPASAEGVQRGLQEIGAACRGCHRPYRL
ncbi:cytochrome c' [Pseudooceanicola batsensis HTCC2597]|uniref:Cytochrome c n=1 Tax=Pseudooceanicola batsensis (strain ATCC BAA-863 / DSM 15984 / KCTC 12145 / HTCC2597) TaxID=252305 RepID=A3TVS5_PSEBH|nr:cytochrome c [Pseudooceanicola batsensis]EAQ03721.1 cytochrome c' [Pseudooceanicola batsensis HTCC2597]